MWKDMIKLGRSVSRFRFMKKEHPNQCVFKLEEVKALYVIMVLKMYFLDITHVAKILDIDRKTVRKYYLNYRHLYERITDDDMFYFFYGEEHRYFKTVDGLGSKKRGRKNRYSY